MPITAHEAFECLTAGLFNPCSPAHKSIRKYAGYVQSGVGDGEDIAQVIGLKLWEWLLTPEGLEEARGLIAEGPQAVARYLTTLRRARAYDWLSWLTAEIRDARVTLSYDYDYQGKHGDTNILLDVASETSGEDAAPFVLLDNVRGGLGWDESRLLGILLSPPAELDKAFRKRNLETQRGSACVEDGYLVLRRGDDSPKSFRLPPGWTKRAVLSTEICDVVLRRFESEYVFLFPFNLTVRLNRKTLRGTFHLKAIKPTVMPWDPDAVQEYLGWSGLRLRTTWTSLRRRIWKCLGDGDPSEW